MELIFILIASGIASTLCTLWKDEYLSGKHLLNTLGLAHPQSKSAFLTARNPDLKEHEWESRCSLESIALHFYGIKIEKLKSRRKTWFFVLVRDFFSSLFAHPQSYHIILIIFFLIPRFTAFFKFIFFYSLFSILLNFFNWKASTFLSALKVGYYLWDIFQTWSETRVFLSSCTCSEL